MYACYVYTLYSRPVGYRIQHEGCIPSPHSGDLILGMQEREITPQPKITRFRVPITFWPDLPKSGFRGFWGFWGCPGIGPQSGHLLEHPEGILPYPTMGATGGYPIRGCPGGCSQMTPKWAQFRASSGTPKYPKIGVCG